MGTICNESRSKPRKEFSKNAEFYFTKFDSYSTDIQIKETVKLEPKINNINENNSCQV